MPLRYRILVPSSERKRTGGIAGRGFRTAQADRASNRFASLTRDRAQALDTFLHALNGAGHAREVLRLNGSLLDKAVRVNLAFHDAPLLDVLQREQGPLFSALDAASLDSAARKRLQNDFVLVCPLLGLLSPADEVPEYRCPVGAQIPGFGSLHAFWKPRISAVLDRLVRGRRVWSFLPARLQALWTQADTSAEVVHVLFQRTSPTGRMLADHAGSQRLAGELSRVLLQSPTTAPEDLAKWKSSAGHRWREDLSRQQGSARTLVFAR
jgi:cytoplasmic iron level regulating protein YaaA (DUF328/UPF0246 family)